MTRVAPLILMLSGVGTIVWGVAGLAEAWASRSWPTVPGVVERSEVVRSTGGTGTNRSSGYRARVVYRYEFEGRIRSGDRLTIGERIAKTRGHAESIAAQHPVGAAVAVHVDPTDPTASVLEAGLDPEAFAVPGFGTALVGVGGYLLVRRRRGPPGDATREIPRAHSPQIGSNRPGLPQ